jgi:hypothetical protein
MGASLTRGRIGERGRGAELDVDGVGCDVSSSGSVHCAASWSCKRDKAEWASPSAVHQWHGLIYQHADNEALTHGSRILSSEIQDRSDQPDNVRASF